METKLDNGEWVKQPWEPKSISQNVHWLHVGKNRLNKHPEIMLSPPIHWALPKTDFHLGKQ